MRGCEIYECLACWIFRFKIICFDYSSGVQYALTVKGLPSRRVGKAPRICDCSTKLNVTLPYPLHKGLVRSQTGSDRGDKDRSPFPCLESNTSVQPITAYFANLAVVAQ